MPESLRATEEFWRVDALPRRAPDIASDIVDALTDVLAVRDRCPGWRTPTSEGLCPICDSPLRLRPLQALALHDIGTLGGAVMPADVGEGKTLTSLLAPYVLDAQRPMLLLPASLVEKTQIERAKLSGHWRIPTNIRPFSYAKLSMVRYREELNEYAPDMIVLDEAHKVKHRDAAVTRRLARYLARNPETRVVAMTGTLMRRSIREFGPLLRWALRERAPVPLNAELDEWADCLDEQSDEFTRPRPGALLRWAPPGDADEISRARQGFQRRLRETPGVVASAKTGTDVRLPPVRGAGAGAPIALHIRALRYPVRPIAERHYWRLRELKQRPDGADLWDASEVWRHAKELALGFHQEWRPPPPEDWRLARKAWYQFVRGVLQRSHSYDSPEDVAMACAAGRLPRETLDAWRAVEPTFVPNPVAVWHDDSALRFVSEWMRQGPGLVWTEHVAFARGLAQLTGASYYGAQGRNDAGRLIDDGDPNRAVIVSVDANREGRNLQRKWNRNLITSLAEGADLNHQLIGRTHRPGQRHSAVLVDVLVGCAEHLAAWDKATCAARSIRDTTGAENKLLVALERRDGAKVEWLSRADIDALQGPRWGTLLGRDSPFAVSEPAPTLR